ncbi:uncharacterized protein LOC112086487 [Eutrema salsugineum]|uniref:uncharacterized protein LOC112086487 n=1 Tax=Eutrema salsugineum TaxID=72664 RepID=UPI000CED2443|nr:uncharacterized protein LOC112086487 [Eutrema salsugineum]
MESQNSGSDANSLCQSFNQKNDGPLCHCSRPTWMSKSWTDENPGRRFFKCNVHGFLTWADKEKPNGWQKVSLLEARDQIRRLKEEIKDLREVKQQGLSATTGDSVMVKSETWKKNYEEMKKLEHEAMASKEREKLLRQFVVLSWGGFIIVTAMIIKMSKT